MEFELFLLNMCSLLAFHSVVYTLFVIMRDWSNSNRQIHKCVCTQCGRFSVATDSGDVNEYNVLLREEDSNGLKGYRLNVSSCSNHDYANGGSMDDLKQQKGKGRLSKICSKLRRVPFNRRREN
ncbi:hypothetical protein ACOME3_002656 [Neoechinorhynchus agilis]